MLTTHPPLTPTEPTVWNSGPRAVLPSPRLGRWRRQGRDHRPGRNNIGLIAQLRGADAELARRQFTVLNVSAGSVLMQQGAAGAEFCYLLEGEVAVHRDGRLVNRIRSGSFFGELALLPNITGSRSRRQATIVTTAPSRVAVCNKAGFDLLVRTFADVQRQVIFQARALTVGSLTAPQSGRVDMGRVDMGRVEMAN